MVIRGTDDSGQWMLLMAFIAAIGMAVLLIFINQSAMGGYSSAGSVLDFPKSDIREIRAETINEVKVIGNYANTEGTNIIDRKSIFATDFDHYASDLRYIYALKGADVEITHEEIAVTYPLIEKVTVNMYYNNGDTEYRENIDVYIT